MNSLLHKTLIIAVILYAASVVKVEAASIITPLPTPSIYDEIEKDIANQSAVRADQVAAIQDGKAALERAGLPAYNKQKEIEKLIEPLVEERGKILEKRKELAATTAQYKARCNSRTFEVPAEQAAYDSCVAEHGELETKRKKNEKELTDIDQRIKPYKDQWMKLEDELEPYMLKWRELKAKLSSIGKEVARLDALLNVFSGCKNLDEKCSTNCSTLELTACKYCHSVVFDGANPNLLLKDTRLAAYDPNLPPLNWKPASFSASPNK